MGPSHSRRLKTKTPKPARKERPFEDDRAPKTDFTKGRAADEANNGEGGEKSEKIGRSLISPRVHNRPEGGIREHCAELRKKPTQNQKTPQPQQPKKKKTGVCKKSKKSVKEKHRIQKETAGPKTRPNVERNGQKEIFRERLTPSHVKMRRRICQANSGCKNRAEREFAGQTGRPQRMASARRPERTSGVIKCKNRRKRGRQGGKRKREKPR